MTRNPKDIRKLVTTLGSYTAAAKVLNISKQRVSQLAGTGLVPRYQPTTCIDCGQVRSATKGLQTPRCQLCAKYFRNHGVPRTPENKARIWQAGVEKRKASILKKSHCIHGHPRTPENLYKNGNCRLCATSPENKKKASAYYRHRYQTDPAFRELLKANKAARLKRKSSAT